jgi:hypothetical protein
MRVTSLLWVFSLLLAGCAGSEVRAPIADAGDAVVPSEIASPQEQASEVDLVVDLSEVENARTVCRREQPTGSRISNTVCRSTEPVDAATANVRDQIVRQEVMDTVRQRQMALDQQRIERQMMRQQ